MKLGFNGSNFWESTPTDWQKMVDATPEGATLYLRFRADQYDGPVPENILLDALAFSKMFTGNKAVRFIYTFHTRGNSVEDNMVGINFFMQNGMQIESFEAGNEEYAEVANDFDFNLYKSRFKPTRDRLKLDFPTIPVSIFVAPRPKSSGITGGRQDHDVWNEQAFEYINSYGDCVSVHCYLNGREIPLIDSVPVVTFNGENFYPEVEGYYSQLFTSIIEESYSFDVLLDYIKSKTDAKIYVTEFGPTANTGGVQNALGYHMGEFYTTITYATEVEVWLKHNGIAKTNTGCITPPKYGETGEDMIPRISLFTYEESQKVALGAIPVIIHPTFDTPSNEVGTYYGDDLIMKSEGYAPYMDKFSDVSSDLNLYNSPIGVQYGFGSYFEPIQHYIQNLEPEYKGTVNTPILIDISATNANTYEWTILEGGTNIHLLGVDSPVLSISATKASRVVLQVVATFDEDMVVGYTEVIFKRQRGKLFSFIKSTL